MRLILFCLFAVLASTLSAAPMIEDPEVTPKSINVGVATQITVACEVVRQGGDPELIPNGVNLIRLDESNRVIAVVGVMKDDGLTGDETANDGMFTYRYVVNEQNAGQVRLQCSAAFRGLLRRVVSSVAVLPIHVFRALPEASPTSGDAPLTVTYRTRGEYSGGSILSFRWDFDGDGVFDTNEPGARDFSRTFTTPGVRNSRLEIRNDRNETTSAVVQIAVGGRPPSASASVNPSNGQVPLTANFSGFGVAGANPIVKYEWDFEGDGTFDYMSATTGVTAFTYMTPGVFAAVFRVTDSAGLTAIATPAATTVRPGPVGSPTATITVPSGPVTRFAPATISFNGTGFDPDGTIVKYEWDFQGDGIYDYNSPTSASTSHTYTAPGTYTVLFRVTDNEGKVGIDTVDVTINIAATISRADPPPRIRSPEHTTTRFRMPAGLSGDRGVGKGVGI